MPSPIAAAQLGACEVCQALRVLEAVRQGGRLEGSGGGGAEASGGRGAARLVTHEMQIEDDFAQRLDKGDEQLHLLGQLEAVGRLLEVRKCCRCPYP